MIKNEIAVIEKLIAEKVERLKQLQSKESCAVIELPNEIYMDYEKLPKNSRLKRLVRE